MCWSAWAGRTGSRSPARWARGNVDSASKFRARGSDEVRLDDAVFTGLAPGRCRPVRSAPAAAAQDSDDRIIYDSSTGALFYDADGNGAGAAVQFATVQPGLVLAASDFTVI